MSQKIFRAFEVQETADNKFIRQIIEKSLDELPEGEVLIKVRYSSLNFKDALSATGNKGVTRNYPHTPGIDAAGSVEESLVDDFRRGDDVIVTGYDMGMNTSGGFEEYIRVPAAWVLKLPDGLSLKESMAYGTAGFTAALSVFQLETHGIKPDNGEVLVTGATGGVGSITVGILAKLGYSVVAATGKHTEKKFLTDLGAKEVISREEVIGIERKALLSERWAGVVDTVGGSILAGAIKSTKYEGVVACCGNAASPELSLTVYPFILRGVRLIGIDSVNCPMPFRMQIWEKIAKDWKLEKLDRITHEISLEEVNHYIDVMMKGNLRGRVIVDLDR